MPTSVTDRDSIREPLEPGTLKRILTYFKETPKLGNFVIAAVAVGAVTHLTLKVLFGLEDTRVSVNYWIGIASYLLFMCHWRVRDEIKDAETDKRVFPERPVPAGRVKLSDVRLLEVIIVSALLVLNAKLWNVAFGYFLFALAYVFLMGRWFFMEKLISNNRMLAFLTHSPMTVFANYYLVLIFCNDHGLPMLTWQSVVTAAWVCLPMFSLEFARKTYPPSQEIEGYQIYSTMLGYRNSALVALSFVLLQFALSVFFQLNFQFHPLLIVSAAVLFLVYAALTFAFIANPDKYFKFFVEYSALYVLLGYIALGVSAVLK